MKKSLLLTIFLLGLLNICLAQTFTTQIVVDNRYALYLGNADGSVVTQEYINSGDFNPTQYDDNAAGSIVLSNPLGLQYLYIVAIDTGSQANISGRVNGFHLVDQFNVDNSYVQMSDTNLRSVISHPNQDSLAVVQNVLSGASPAGTLGWGNPGAIVGTGNAGITLNPFAENSAGNRVGFVMTPNDTRIFRLRADAFDIVPEPSSVALLGLGTLGFIVRRNRT